MGWKVLPLTAVLSLTASLTLLFAGSSVAAGHSGGAAPDPLAQIVIGPPTSTETLATWRQHHVNFEERNPSGRNINALQAIAVARHDVGDPQVYVSAVRFGKLLPGTLPESLVGKMGRIVVFPNNTMPLSGKPGLQPVTSLVVVGTNGKALSMSSY